jgi:uncharacterized protein (TIGR00266 family)
VFVIQIKRHYPIKINMQQHIKHAPTFSMLELTLGPGEIVVAEAGVMVARDSKLQMEVKLNSGKKAGFFGTMKALCIALIRKMIGGETFFVNHFSSPTGGWVWLAPALSGSIQHIAMKGQSLIMNAGAFVASTGDIDIKMRWGGLRAIFAKEGAFFLEASGSGDLWFNSYGAIQEIQCDGSYIVDTGHLVAFDPSLDMQIRAAGGGMMGLFASGEGLVCEFTGKGRIWLQTRNTSSLVGWVLPMLPS